MKKVCPEDVNPKHGSFLLCDLSSLGAILTEAENLQFSSPDAVSYYKHRLQLGDIHAQQLFEVLSNILCFERFLVDHRALYSYQQAHQLLEILSKLGLSELFSGVSFPIASYNVAAENVIALRRAILENAPKRLLKSTDGNLESLFGYRETMLVDDATLKDMYDRRYFLERPDFSPDLPRNFADTGMSVERLFVYLEVARTLDVPVSLARSKYGALKEIGSRAKAIAKAIEIEMMRQTLGTKTGLDFIQEIVQETALPKVTLLAPLLPSHVLRVAENRSCSVMEAVFFIRNESACAAFREYVWQNRRAFDPVYAGDHLKAKELEKTLADIGRRIALAKSSTGIFKDMKKITLNLSSVPVLKHLLGIIGKKKIKLSVPLPRNPPLYEVFMAEWFA